MTFKRVVAGLVVLVALAAVGTWLTMPALAHREPLITRMLELTLGDVFLQLKGQEKNAPITLKAGETVRLVLRARSCTTGQGP